MKQNTIAHHIECSGIGLHSGKTVRMGFYPAPVNTGIRFEIHAADGVHTLQPSPEKVIATGLATTLGDAVASVATVEHVLAAISGLGIDNILITVYGKEIPIMDGSAASFVMLFNTVGLKEQNALRTAWRIRKPMNYEKNGKSITALPYAGFKVDYTIKFPHPAIGTQKTVLDVTPTSFSNAVARARTFGFLHEVEAMHARGLALGGTLDNAIVLDERGVLNEDGLRYTDEFVRHKVLDFIGDMAMFGHPLQGHFIVHCSGHALNNSFLRVLDENKAIYLEKVNAATPLPVKPKYVFPHPFKQGQTVAASM